MIFDRQPSHVLPSTLEAKCATVSVPHHSSSVIAFEGAGMKCSDGVESCTVDCAQDLAEA
jgi:hypothetical protein